MLDEFVEVEDLFVLPEWMGRGLGRALVDDVVVAAKARGALGVEVTANHHALAFLQQARLRLRPRGHDAVRQRAAPAS